MKTRILFGVAIWLGIALSAPGAEKAGALLGRWSCQGEEGATVLEFQSANTLVYDGEANQYRLQGDAIMVQGMWGEEAYRYRLKGKRLDVAFPDGEKIQCTRPDATAERKHGSGADSSGGNAQLRGRLCRWSGSSSSYSGTSSSSTATIEFDGRGNAMYSSESSFNSREGLAYGSSGGTPGTYRVEGDTVSIQLQDGTQVVARVEMRQNDGRITELMANGKLWATGLCE
ncbi:MAG: hypothetical protein Q7T25_01985 [Sideroxyarcus sp.]|nr:hypothetical protein [Sideroxyarcus sp.]